jgi:hypothetical protein
MDDTFQQTQGVSNDPRHLVGKIKRGKLGLRHKKMIFGSRHLPRTNNVDGLDKFYRGFSLKYRFERKNNRKIAVDSFRIWQK